MWALPSPVTGFQAEITWLFIKIRFYYGYRGRRTEGFTNSVFLSLMVTSRLECCCCHSGHCNRGWQHSNELEAQAPLLKEQFQASLSPRSLCTVLIFSFSSPEVCISSLNVLSTPSCSTTVFCKWRFRSVSLGSVQSDMPECVSLESQLSHSFTAWEVQNKQLSEAKQ